MRFMSICSWVAKTTRFLWIHPLNSLESEEQSSNTSVGDVQFEFFDVGEVIKSGQNASGLKQCHSLEMDLDDDEENDRSSITKKNQIFWESQHLDLQTNIDNTSSLETNIRSATKEAIEEIESCGTVCGCTRKKGAITSCRDCLMREVFRRLHKTGFNIAICKTKWRTSSDIPSGEHTFLDVIDNTNPEKGEVRVMIEMNFQAEFEMAKGSDEYNNLVKKVPEVFVGEVGRMSKLIKILCMAAKKCMKDKKLHMGPWRRHKYMEAKWLGPCERYPSTKSPLSIGSFSERIITKQKSKVSMLTIELFDKLPTLHCPAVDEVV